LIIDIEIYKLIYII